jgi:hypothetical protein
MPLEPHAIIVDGDRDHLTWETGLFKATLAARFHIAQGAQKVEIAVKDERSFRGLRCVSFYPRPDQIEHK